MIALLHAAPAHGAVERYVEQIAAALGDDAGCPPFCAMAWWAVDDRLARWARTVARCTVSDAAVSATAHRTPNTARRVRSERGRAATGGI